MPRIAPLASPYPPDVQAHFDAVMPPGAPPLTLFTTIARSERAWRKFRAGSLLDRGPLSLRQREIVILRTCALARCEYEWGVHVAAFAHAAKLSDQEVQATARTSAECPSWSEAERALLETADALHARATLSDGEFERLAAFFDTDQVLEILMLAGFYRTVSYIANGVDLALEAKAARFVPAPA